MTYEEALYHAKSGKALLFYGSGMAYDVLNMRDEKMPTGAALSHILCKESGFKEEEYHDDLEHSSQEYIEIKGDISLIKLLKEVFKTKNSLIITLKFQKLHGKVFSLQIMIIH